MNPSRKLSTGAGQVQLDDVSLVMMLVIIDKASLSDYYCLPTKLFESMMPDCR